MSPERRERRERREEKETYVGRLQSLEGSESATPLRPERRAHWTFPGRGQDTAAQARFNAGIAYGLWGVGDEVAEALGELAGHLTAHVVRVIPARPYVVIAVLARNRATVSVLAPGRRPVGVTDPGTRPAIRRLADSWGRLQHAAGPGVHATKVLSPSPRIPHTVEPNHVVEPQQQRRESST